MTFTSIIYDFRSFESISLVEPGALARIAQQLAREHYL
jgi:hypothetical protein